MASHARVHNDVLHALNDDAFVALREHLRAVELPTERRLAEAHQPISHVYFLDSGIASTTSMLRRDEPVEIGLVGREGVVNLAALLGTDQTPFDTYMQVGGTGHSIETDQLRSVMRDQPDLLRVVLLSAYVALAQIASTALSNNRGTVTERLARWLLMAQDRIEGDDIALTHRIISIMLGVRRAGVTVALSELERQGLVTLGHRMVRIIDREGLRKAANGSYGVAESEYRRLFPQPTGRA